MGFIPPNGYMGFGQQSQAVQAGTRKILDGAASRAGGAIKKAYGAFKRRGQGSKGLKKISKRSLVSKRRKMPKSKRPAHMVKGSTAAKQHMAKIRRKKKK